MQVHSTPNNISFQSKIKFVPYQTFLEKELLPVVDCHKPVEPFRLSFIKDSDFWTGDIRTCTAGGIIDDNGALGFHLFDCVENVNNAGESMPKIIDYSNGQNKSALLIGAKKLPTRCNSVPLFNKVRSIVERFVTPSIFGVHKNNYAESNIAYEKALDTWFVNTPLPKYPTYMPNEPFVDSLETLLSAFKEIKIAPQDTLFIGEKQITKKDCPTIFYEG